MRNLIRKIRQRQEGITGLETAIILIAFVIVASVFSYVVLSSGLFSSQKVKEAINAGINSSTSTIELRGNVVAKMENGEVTEIYLHVGIPGAGSPVDFSPSSENISPMVISYSDADTIIPSLDFTVTRLSSVNDDYLLEANEQFLVTIIMPISDNVSVGAYDEFALEIKPADGPTLTIERSIPGRVSDYINLN